MKKEIMCTTCGLAKGGVFAKMIAARSGDRSGLLDKPDYFADICCRYNGAPDPITHERYTKPKEVLEGAECFHYITEDEAKAKHVPNYCLP